MKKIISVFLLLVLLVMAGCTPAVPSPSVPDDTAGGGAEVTDGPSETENTPSEVPSLGDEDMFTARDRDADYSDEKSTVISLNGSSAVCSSDAVRISGGRITVTDEGTYIFRGTLTNGQIVVDADDKDKPRIVLDGADITSSDFAPIYVLSADKVVITLESGSSNSLTNGGSFVSSDGSNIDGAVFSKADITFNGSGSLTVNSPVGHAIVGKDDVVFTGGSYTLNSSSHGIDANDSVRVLDGSFNIVSGKDGIHADNADDSTLGFVYITGGNFTVSSEGDGISAGGYMKINGGEFDITTGGGSENSKKQTSDNWGDFMGGFGGGMLKPGRKDSPEISGTSDITSVTDDGSTSIKGLKSTGNMELNGGSFKINSADDSVHSNGSIDINGGKYDISSGDDGFHADDTLTVSGGEINIIESYEGLEALHIFYKNGKTSLVADDDGLNAAGGTDGSGFGGDRGNDMFSGITGKPMASGGRPDGMGGPGGPGGFGGMGGSSNGSIVISGGELHINASGDGIDANGYLEITGGYTVVVGPTQGDTATLDYDTTGTISGGTFIGTGASGMAQSFSDSSQGVIAVKVGNQSPGTEVSLTDKNGNVIVSFAPELSFAVVIISSPDMIKGENYIINVGSASGEFSAS
ncbi:MAG: carbohydrate-binding domain-containing protein [Clostridia bacterium]|nr:carbohydrate-binding domain-containing protein [Clostridia bacterium]